VSILPMYQAKKVSSHIYMCAKGEQPYIYVC